MIQIPLQLDVPLYDFRVNLDGSDYIGRLDYHERIDRWYFNLYTVDGVVIVAGLKMVLNWPLLKQVTSPIAPPGQLMILDGTTKESPGFHALGRSALLFYLTAADLGIDV